MPPAEERSKYAIRHLLEETTTFGQRAKHYERLHTALGVLTITAGGAGFLAPVIGIENKIWTQLLSLLAAVLAFVQNARQFKQQSTRYNIAYGVMKRAVTQFNLDQTDKMGLFKAYDQALALTNGEGTSNNPAIPAGD